MKIYDWIVIGGGITGASLAYELSQQKLRVLLVEKDAKPDNATVYSYGGLAYWSGTDELTRQLGQEGIELHRQLTAELAGDTEFRELDLVLTIDKQDDPATIAQNYQRFAIKPKILDPATACEVEPLLNPNAIAGALTLPHGHIHPQKTTAAYLQAFSRNGGQIVCERAIDLEQKDGKILGVKTDKNSYCAENTVVASGGLTRSLLQNANITVDNYFTHAQVIVTPPLDLKLNAIVMPAVQRRFALEADVGDVDWDKSQSAPITSILDTGAVQFLDGSLRIGQISAIVTNPQANLDTTKGETAIRQKIVNILPAIGNVKGTCHNCLVAFNNKNIALIGKVPSRQQLYLFSGFTSTLVFAPILARRFANWVTGKQDEIIDRLLIDK